LGRLCGCLWFGGYVNFVEIFGFVIVGFSGLQWQVCDCLLQWVKIVGLSCGRRLLALVSCWWWWRLRLPWVWWKERKIENC